MKKKVNNTNHLTPNKRKQPLYAGTLRTPGFLHGSLNLSIYNKYVICLLSCLLLYCPTEAFADGWRRYQRKLRTSWSININAGRTSYFGDLSIYDQNISKKLTKESCNSYGLIATKNFNSFIGISGQLLYGHIKASHSKFNFKSQLLEYNFHLRIDPLNIFLQNKSPRAGLTIFAGIGQLLFKTEKTFNSDMPIKKAEYQSEVPEFIYFFGTGIYYKLTNKIRATADLSIKQCQNDRLDDFVKGDDFDYYSYLSLGITFYIANSNKHYHCKMTRFEKNKKKLRRLSRRFNKSYGRF